MALVLTNSNPFKTPKARISLPTIGKPAKMDLALPAGSPLSFAVYAEKAHSGQKPIDSLWLHIELFQGDEMVLETKCVGIDGQRQKTGTSIGVTFWGGDGWGICVGCTNSNQCPNDTFCRDIYCNNQQQCDHNDTANHTPLPSQDQTIGDCQELQCDGSGGTKSVNVNDPLVDGNECTSDLCTNGTPTNPPVADGTPCTGGNCSSGVCQ